MQSTCNCCYDVGNRLYMDRLKNNDGFPTIKWHIPDCDKDKSNKAQDLGQALAQPRRYLKQKSFVVRRLRDLIVYSSNPIIQLENMMGAVATTLLNAGLLFQVMMENGHCFTDLFTHEMYKKCMYAQAIAQWLVINEYQFRHGNWDLISETAGEIFKPDLNDDPCIFCRFYGTECTHLCCFCHNMHPLSVPHEVPLIKKRKQSEKIKIMGASHTNHQKQTIYLDCEEKPDWYVSDVVPVVNCRVYVSASKPLGILSAKYYASTFAFKGFPSHYLTEFTKGNNLILYNAALAQMQKNQKHWEKGQYMREQNRLQREAKKKHTNSYSNKSSSNVKLRPPKHISDHFSITCCQNEQVPDFLKCYDKNRIAAVDSDIRNSEAKKLYLALENTQNDYGEGLILNVQPDVPIINTEMLKHVYKTNSAVSCINLDGQYIEYLSYDVNV
ncbi:16sRNA processing protein motif protein [Ranid herpesvirus 3]|uniref:16sRNA processing protein motif protein n=1 Tax=Ranid herpesvirus 3 TaxID=1987509 RepID=A0A1X9T550_9VIRU|nr:16sRNA processing protein motif protein [Ranid herpesvirus 3]ARR28828.1 16sRNA processing protein motif protein [Ranid herpesvirus 3]